MKLKLVGDGTFQNTHLVDAEKGILIENATRVEIKLNEKTYYPEVVVTFQNIEIDLNVNPFKKDGEEK